MPKNGWTKADIIELASYGEAYEIMFGDDIIDLCLPNLKSRGFDLWAGGEENWYDDEDECLAIDASPTFTYRDDNHYHNIHELEDCAKNKITVERVTRTKIPWGSSRKAQVAIEEINQSSK